jgi:hypothetical protein
VGNLTFSERIELDVSTADIAKCATLAKEADDPEEREHYARMRDAWITLANRCEFYSVPDVTDSEQ